MSDADQERLLSPLGSEHPIITKRYLPNFPPTNDFKTKKDEEEEK
jgi:hypothetical protein